MSSQEEALSRCPGLLPCAHFNLTPWLLVRINCLLLTLLRVSFPSIMKCSLVFIQIVSICPYFLFLLAQGERGVFVLCSCLWPEK